MKQQLGAIILAAGRGSRMNSKGVNKVTLPIADKPMILHTVHTLQKIHVNPIVVVVGFAKKSVVQLFKGEEVIFAEQRKRLGTGHAAACGLKKLPPSVTDVLLFYGDDSAFYTDEVILKVMERHVETGAALTFLTLELKNPKGLGRVVRDKSGKVIAIAEEKDATDEQRKIKEINPACYVFSVAFLRKYLPKIKKSEVTGEYYLTHLIDMAIHSGQVVETVKEKNIPWRGVNSKEELEEAEKIYYSTTKRK